MFNLDGNQTQHTHTHTLNQFREEVFWEYNRMTAIPSYANMCRKLVDTKSQKLKGFKVDKK